MNNTVADQLFTAIGREGKVDYLVANGGLPSSSVNEQTEPPEPGSLWKCLSALLLVGGILFSLFLFIGAFRFSPSTPSQENRTTTVHNTKPIEEIVVGDMVLAEDPETGVKSLKRVVAAYQRTVNHLQMVELKGSDGKSQVIKTTDEHPFWVEQKGWVDAKALKVGDHVRQLDGKVAVVTSNSYEPHPEGVEVFNCQVEGFHTYFVASDGARGPPVLVHNTNKACQELIQIGMDRVRKAAPKVIRSTSGNAAILGQNLAREGRAPGAGQAAGHIVASTGTKRHWQAAARSREILARYRIDINDAANGIPITTPRPHNTMHTRSFNERVENRLSTIVDRMTANRYGHRAIRSALRRELRKMGREVLSGGLK